MKKDSVRDIYLGKINRFSTELGKLESANNLFSWVRVGMILAIILSVIIGIKIESSLLFPIYLFLGGFIIALFTGLYFEKKIELKKLLISFYNQGVDRINDNWYGKGNQRNDFVKEHPYSKDLDLFGKGSLFELLNTGKTKYGEDTLARWLLNLPTREEIIDRQKAVKELAPMLEFKEGLTIAGGSVSDEVHGESLIEWAEKPYVFKNVTAYSVFSSIISFLLLLSFFLWLIFDLTLLVFLGALIFSFILRFITRKKVYSVTKTVSTTGRELIVIGKALYSLENTEFKSKKLKYIKKKISSSKKSASSKITSLNTLIAWLDSQKNQIFALIAFVILWDLHFALAIEKWRKNNGGLIRVWLETVGELEALSSLSTYAYEHSDNVFPTIAEDEFVFIGDDMSHPLMPEDKFVRNSVALSKDVSVLVVSGSNMSGKSTLLRTIGINSVLAFAGSVVPCSSLKLSLFYIGSSMRISDSLHDGISRFYAEINRLKLLMTLTEKEFPLFFLIDEILSGTNSHDRKIGSQGYIRELIQRGAAGLVTTHDLALTNIEGTLSNRIENIHFVDELIDGKLHFDFKIRPGIVQKSNAIRLMRAVGLVVFEE